MSEFKHKGRTTSNRGNCSHKAKLSKRDIQVLIWSISKKTQNHSFPTPSWVKCTPLLTFFHQNCLSRAPQVQYSLLRCYRYTFDFSGDSSRYLGLWTVWNVLFFDESTFTLLPLYGRVMMWRSPKELYHLGCCKPRVNPVGIYDGLGCNIMAFPKSTTCARWACRCPGQPNHSGGLCWRNILCTYWFKHCILNLMQCIRTIMHQYTQQVECGIWIWGFVNEWFDECDQGRF